jgi:DeoR family fructose operon transcriptional repressor
LEENIFAEERKHMIVEMVNANVKITVAELCDRFSVSPATIRNDLRELEESGRLKRTHGGAISNRRANFEQDSYQKEVKRVSQKRDIAAAAVKYVNEGDTIVVDTGTTTFEFAKLLKNFESLNVVTNDIQIAAYLERNTEANIIIAGGAVRRNYHYTTGQKAIDTIADLNVDRAFIGVNGVSAKKGITVPHIDTAYVKAKIIEISDEIVLLADSTKLDRFSFVKCAEIDKVDVLITDDEADAEYLEKIREKGVDVRWRLRKTITNDNGQRRRRLHKGRRYTIIMVGGCVEKAPCDTPKSQKRGTCKQI